MINGIAGDYTDKQLKGAFAVNSFDYPTSNVGSAQSGAALTSFDPLKLSLNTESLAGLLAASSSSTLLTGASLVGRTTINGKTVITSSLNLTNVVITNVSETDINQGIDLTLDYNRIGLVTTGYDSNGTQASQTFAWDVKANRNPGGGGTSVTSAGTNAVATTRPATYYLLVDGVNGGSTDPNHVGWFELQDLQRGLRSQSRHGPHHQGRRQGQRRPRDQLRPQPGVPYHQRRKRQ